MCTAGVARNFPGSNNFTGSVEGTLRDPSGSVLPGVLVELTNVSTGMTQKQVSSSAGDYGFNSVKPGSYHLRASFAGFQDGQLTHLRLT